MADNTWLSFILYYDGRKISAYSGRRGKACCHCRCFRLYPFIFPDFPAHIPADRITVYGRISVAVSRKSYITPVCHTWRNAAGTSALFWQTAGLRGSWYINQAVSGIVYVSIMCNPGYYLTAEHRGHSAGICSVPVCGKLHPVWETPAGISGSSVPIPMPFPSVWEIYSCP